MASARLLEAAHNQTRRREDRAKHFPRIKTLEREYKGIEGELARLREKVANQGKVGAAKSTPVGMNISGRIRVLERKLHGIDAQINKLTHADRVLGQRIGAQGKVVPRASARRSPDASAGPPLVRRAHEVRR